MPKKILDLIVKVKDEASKDLAKIEGTSGFGGIKGLTKGLTNMINPATMAAGAITALGIAAVKAFSEFQSYTREVSDFAAMIGATTEEASVFIKMSKDFDITMDTMLAAFRTLAQQGIPPTIEGLISVKTMLDNTSSASERLALAQRTIGEQGIKQLLPMFDRLTNEELREYADGMEGALIVTEEMNQLMIDNEKTIKDVTNAWKEYKVRVGYDLALMFDATAFALRSLNTATEESEEAAQAFVGGVAWDEFVRVLEKYIIKMRLAEEETGNMAYSIYQLDNTWNAFSVNFESRYINTFMLGQIISDNRRQLDNDAPAMIAHLAGIANVFFDIGDNAQTGWEKAITGMRSFTKSSIENKLEMMVWDQIMEDGVITAGELDTALGILNDAGMDTSGFEAAGLAALRMGGRYDIAALAAENLFQKLKSVIGAGSLQAQTPGGAGGTGTISVGGQTFQDAEWRGNQLWVRGQLYGTYPDQQFGGSFTVAGFGGIDSEMVSFKATPGEKVTVGGGDNEDLLKEMKRMSQGVDRLGRVIPIAIKDAIERIV